MGYEKLTPAKFKERLSSGGYKNAGGARKSVGKSDWSDVDKDKMRALIDKHFGAEAAQPEKKAAKKKAPVKKAAKKGRVKKAAAKPVKKGRVKKAPTKKVAKKTRAVAKRQPKIDAGADASLAEIHIVGQVVGTITQAINAMEKANSVGGGSIKVAEGLRAAQSGLTGAVNHLNSEVVSKWSAPKKSANNGVTKPIPSFADAAPAAVGLPAEEEIES